MKTKKYIKDIIRITSCLLLVSMAMTTVSCGPNKAKQKIAEQRSEWENSLSDSVAVAERGVDSLRQHLDRLHTDTETLLQQFRCVQNPREVEKYYIANLAGLQYPLQTTGIVARLNASEQLEVIAAFAGPAFDCIEVSSGGEWVRSNVVPEDKALNYRVGGLSRVMFFGSAADSVAMCVAASAEAPLRLRFLADGGRKVVGQTNISAIDRSAVSLACNLATLRKETLLTEQRLNTQSRKVAILKEKCVEIAERNQSASR